MAFRSIPIVRVFGDPRLARTAAVIFCFGAAAHFALVLFSSFGNMPDLRQVFVPSARAAYNGMAIYHPLPVGAPGHFTVGTSGAVDTPPFVLLMWPWTVLGDSAGQLAWEGLQILALLSAVIVTYTGIGRPTRTELIVVATVSMFLGPVRDSLQDGQVSIVLGALMAAAMLGHRNGRPGLGGVALGFAGAIKLTPLLTLPYFVWKRDWRLSLWAIGTSITLFGLSIASGRTNGLGAFPAVLVQMSAGTAAAQNQSLSGLVLRMVLPYRTSFPITPPPLDVRLVITIIQLAALAGLGWLVRQVRLPAPLGPWLEFSLLLLLIPAIQPFAWPHHWAWAVMAVPVGVRLASRRLLHPAVAWGLVGTFAIMTLLEFPLYAAAVAYDSHPPAPLPLALGASLTLVSMVAIALFLGLGLRPGAATDRRLTRSGADSH